MAHPAEREHLPPIQPLHADLVLDRLERLSSDMLLHALVNHAPDAWVSEALSLGSPPVDLGIFWLLDDSHVAAPLDRPHIWPVRVVTLSHEDAPLVLALTGDAETGRAWLVLELPAAPDATLAGEPGRRRWLRE